MKSMPAATTIAVLLTAVTATSVLADAPSLRGDAMQILTYPTGLVLGELEVKVDLGPGARPAELFLDGEMACSMSPRRGANGTTPQRGANGTTAEAKTSCTVDLGADPHVHLLELVRDDGARVERWINRPGQEAELSLLPLPPSGSGPCQARISWAHPERQSPVELEVILPGAQPKISGGGRTVSFPCPRANEPQMLVAMAVFPDGRRVESTAVVGGFTDQTSVELHAVPLVAGPETPCQAGATSGGAPIWPRAAERLEKSGFEVVIVLDPAASYVPLRNSGWNTGQMAAGSGAGTKVFDRVVRSGSKDSEPEPKNSWLKAKTTLFDADRLWYVAPDQGLHRVNGFGAGRPNWLDLLFKFGLADVPGKPRIADAVAASGLVAAAGPRRRAVVLVLGNNVHKRDGSRFTPQQAREYLAEVNVPLLVLRNGKRKEDGWPPGLSALNMEVMSKSLRTVREVLDAQCIGWFASRWQPDRLERELPEGVRLAGRGADAPTSPESVWARAAIELTAEVPEPIPQGLAVERLDITAVTVVVSAVDAKGRPVSDLSAEDFTVTEDGTSATVLGLAPVRTAAPEPPVETLDQPAEAPPGQRQQGKDLPVAIYVNRTVGGGFDQRQALRAVAGELERLAALGPLEIVVAEKEQVKTLIGPTRDLPALATALEELAGRKTGQHAIERIRRRFVQDVRQIPDRFTENDVGEGGLTVPNPVSRITFAARTSAGEEHVIVSRSLEQLRFWAQRETGQRAGLLVLVGAGFDEDPLDFYAPFVEKQEPHNVSQLREDLRSLKKAGSVNNLGRELASTGWRILAVAGQTTGNSTTGADSRTDKFISFLSASSDTVHAADVEYLLLDPIDAQRNLAEPSGGDVVIGPAGLTRALDQSTGWYQLTYQVDRAPDGEPHELELAMRRPGIEVNTTRVVTAATSEGQAAARGRRLLGGAAEQGELTIDLAVGTPQPGKSGKLTAEVEVTVHFGDLAPLMRPGAALRVSVATVAADAEPVVDHRREQLAEVAAGWVYTFPTEWPDAAAGRLAVTVEDIASGVWGGTVVDLPASP